MFLLLAVWFGSASSEPPPANNLARGVLTNPQWGPNMASHNTPWSPWDPIKQVVVGGFANPNILPVGGVQCYMCTAMADDCYTGDLCVGELCSKSVVKYPDGRATVLKQCVLSNPRAIVEQYVMYQDDTKTNVHTELLCSRSRCNGSTTIHRVRTFSSLILLLPLLIALRRLL